MRTYPIMQNGEKVVLDDLNAAFLAAGNADDDVRASLNKIFIETTNRLGYVQPWHDGPIVVNNGSTGTVQVRPFEAFRSPVGAATNGGTEDATSTPGVTGDLHGDMTSAFYAGSGTAGFAIATPLPTSGNMRWDLLYAIISDADGSPAARLVKDPVLKTISTQTINTRHAPSVTLAWVQGTASPVGTDPYPSANMPALPTPPAGVAYVPLALVQVQYAATPSSVSYTTNAIANIPRLARQNPQTGANISSILAVSSKKTAANGLIADAYDLITLGSAAGGWATSPGGDGFGIRPVRWVDPGQGSLELWIAVGPFYAGGTPAFGTSWTFLTDYPIAAPNPLGSSLGANLTGGKGPLGSPQVNFLNRWFQGSLVYSLSTALFAHDPTTATHRRMPSTLNVGGGGSTFQTFAWGQSVAEDTDWESVEYSFPGFRVAAIFRAVNGVSGDDLGVFVRSVDGALFLGGRSNGGAGAINNGVGVIRLGVSPQLAPYGY